MCGRTRGVFTHQRLIIRQNPDKEEAKTGGTLVFGLLRYRNILILGAKIVQQGNKKSFDLKYFVLKD